MKHTEEQRAVRRLLDHVGPVGYIRLERHEDTLYGIIEERNGAPNSSVKRFQVWTTQIAASNGAPSPPKVAKWRRWSPAARAKQRKIMKELWKTRWQSRRKSGGSTEPS